MNPPASSAANSQATVERTRFAGLAILLLVLALGAIYVATHLIADIAPVREGSLFPYLLLGVALVIALGFEFVNGFHDTAHAVATVIYAIPTWVKVAVTIALGLGLGLGLGL